MKANPFDNISELKEEFYSLLVQEKKVKALKNYEETGLFKHNSFLALIKICLERSFPKKQEVDFLDFLLAQYHINFYNWSYKGKWTKKQIKKLKKQAAAPVEQPMLFALDKDKRKKPFEVPVNLLNKTGMRGRAARA